MPTPSRNWGAEVENPYISEQLDYDPQDERQAAALRVAQLNPEQRSAFDQIVDCVLRHRSKVFFINGPGGTGKTFVYEALCHKIRGEGLIVLCVASSGLASLLLRGGRTAHSRFKIPVEQINADSTCAIPKE
ncbi:PIF1-like helicase-domain-containing protein, partial [Lenzites betulinus]